MDKTSSSTSVRSGESRSYVDMGETQADFEAMFQQRLSEPGKQYSGRRRVLTNEEEWYLWKLKDHCTLKQLAQDLKICKDKVMDHRKRLEEQGGPKGEKPGWVK